MRKITKKKGLFLSVEVVVVLIVLALIVGLIIAGMTHLLRMYKLYRISNDIARYSEAVINFRNAYDYYPGDVPISASNGVLNNTTVVADITSISGSAAITTSADKTFGNGRVSPWKSLVAFKQMALAKLIPENIVTVNTPITGPSMDFSAQMGTTAPIASFDKTLLWTFVLDISATETNYVSNSLIYATPAVYSANWSGRPRLVLIKALDEITASGLPRVDRAKKYGSLSANLAASVDVKFDDGFPYGTGSRIIGENIAITAGGNGCHDKTTATTYDSSASYVKNSATDSLQTCLITIGIDISE